MSNYRNKRIKVVLPFEVLIKVSLRHEQPSTNDVSRRERIRIRFDINDVSCYKSNTSPLFPRGQGARRLTTASAFLTVDSHGLPISQGA